MEHKTQTVDGVTYRYRTGWNLELEAERHWRLYWRQQKLMDGLVSAGDRVLEIGVGSGFTANYLRSKGVRVTTLDIDEGKHPDIVANLVTHEFAERYAHVLAFQVLEHVPYDHAVLALGRLAKCCDGHVFLGIPTNRKVWFDFSLKLPKQKRVSWRVVRKKNRISEANHFWEIDHGGITEPVIERLFSDVGFCIRRKDEAFHRCYYALEVGGP